MDAEIKALVLSTKKRLLEDLPKFLESNDKFAFGSSIDSFATTVLGKLEGKMDSSTNFSEFVNILYGCQQLDDFGESWAPTKEKITAWIAFLKKFSV
ncbi:MAG: hypothetical protein COV47_00390 [Candidatus Diapherotrites archaeon CG11_big_fil_rev_8_21_14_0_20_37_9]|nr:MAG: hypothetical protein COV47_00390 [Candidatus Diapherotrites archaeon CG11_big_fil_rev_8_21_14_0_20_37_9]